MMYHLMLLLALMSSLSMMNSVQAFAPPIAPLTSRYLVPPNNQFQPINRRHRDVYSDQLFHTRHKTSLSVLGTGVASLLAGSVGGAIGVGVAYPFDTIKTKAQVYSNNQRRIQQRQQSLLLQNATTFIEHAPSGMVHPPHSSSYIPIVSPEDDLISLVRLILELEGISGFFGGVRAMMMGQALIKSVAFSANELALGVLQQGVDSGGDVPFGTLLIAASFSGLVTSFLVAPVGECIIC
jgi:hypothetical protein